MEKINSREAISPVQTSKPRSQSINVLFCQNFILLFRYVDIYEEFMPEYANGIDLSGLAVPSSQNQPTSTVSPPVLQRCSPMPPFTYMDSAVYSSFTDVAKSYLVYNIDGFQLKLTNMYVT